MAGGAATGVLQKGQMEVMSSYKYSYSDRFQSGALDTVAFFDNLSSNYLYFKTDFGISKKLTLSLSTGYYLNRTITEFADTTYVGSEMEIEQVEVSSKGIGDFIIFPRYSLFSKENHGHKTEMSFGVGMKIPFGHANDSNFVGYSQFVNFETNPPTLDSTEIWVTSPPTVQTTTGSQDLMFSTFFLRSYPEKNLRMFANALYVHKGWNSLGLKFGNYTSIGLSVGTTLFDKLGLVAQFKGEMIGKMKAHEMIDPLSIYSIDMSSTGSKMLSFSPQISFTITKGLSAFVTADIPLYQNLDGTQVASQHQVTGGISYRFFLKEPEDEITEAIIPPSEADLALYDRTTMKVWGICEMCKERIEATVLAMDGVGSAVWDLETLMLSLHYDKDRVTLDEIRTKLAKVGHDTEEVKATDRAYNKLHSCCKYDRK